MNRLPHIGKDAAAEFLQRWIVDKTNIVLVTGRASYAKCGAEAFFAPFLTGKNVTHLTTVGENARTEDVEEKISQLPPRVDAFIAVGGGTVIDTTKLLRTGIPPLSNSNSSLQRTPCLAVPTTAGTGAEATRFAVYYDHGVKKSADDERYLPTDVVLIPEFTATQSPYQRASTEFDAYAQAVESLWAKGATPESKRFALKALQLMHCEAACEAPNSSEGLRSPSEGIRCIHRGFPEEELRNRSEGECLLAQLQGSYWAGRAIDISRTTAAHAFSYYMTATYGIPHGHAVYMMFPYICKNNGHPEFIKEVPELQSLKDFSAEKGLDWSDLVDDLFAHVNLKRLGNNPVEVRKESFVNPDFPETSTNVPV